MRLTPGEQVGEGPQAGGEHGPDADRGALFQTIPDGELPGDGGTKRDTGKHGYHETTHRNLLTRAHGRSTHECRAS